MNAPLAYWNGRIMPFLDAHLPLHDAGFVSGATIVDNARTYRQRLFRWPDHLDRFRRDCAACFVPLKLSDPELTAIAEELIAQNAKLLPPGGELQVVTFATPGSLGFYCGESTSGPPTLGMATYPLPFARYRKFFTAGATLVLLPNGASSMLLPPTIKHRSRMFWHVADHKARLQTGNPSALALPLGPDDTLTETSVANCLAVLNGTIIEPPRETVLPGISLQVVRELCAAQSIPVIEQPIRAPDVPNLDELLLTGTAFGIAAVREPHTTVWPGPVFTKLREAWSELVGVNIEQQFLSMGITDN